MREYSLPRPPLTRWQVVRGLGGPRASPGRRWVPTARGQDTPPKSRGVAGGGQRGSPAKIPPPNIPPPSHPITFAKGPMASPAPSARHRGASWPGSAGPWRGRKVIPPSSCSSSNEMLRGSSPPEATGWAPNLEFLSLGYLRLRLK